MRRSIRCISEQISRSNAERIVADASGREARVERTLYYPYLWYRSRYSLSTLFGRPRFEIDCLVDARQGLVSTADVFETRELRPPPGDVLEVCVDTDSGAIAAHRTMSHELKRKHRVVAPFELEMDPGQTLYKKFWVVRCGTDGPSVLLDSTTASFIALTGATG